MKELSIFVDESGDFGEYDFHCPYYIISFVFHDQNVSIIDELTKLNTALTNIGLSNHCVHTGPIIRGEEEYRYMDIKERQKALMQMMGFIRRMNIKCKSIYIEKKQFNESIDAIGNLSKQLSRFIRENMEYFYGYDKVKVYYDNGQIEVTKILSSVFNVLLDNVEFKRVLPKDYRLFQVADCICTMKLLELKAEAKILSNSEIKFFNDVKTLRKNYFKVVWQKEL